MAPSVQSSSVGRGSRLLGVLAVIAAGVAAGLLLFPDPLADAFFAAWVLVAVGLAVVGALGAWTNRTPVVWVAALLTTGLSIVGMWSIGPFVAPAALFLLGSALLSRAAGPRAGVREAIVADPPTVPEAVFRTLAGSAGVVVGAGLVYVGAIARELFGSCSNETLACAIGATHWDAVGTTALGLALVALGGWVLWKQIYVARVLASSYAG